MDVKRALQRLGGQPPLPPPPTAMEIITASLQGGGGTPPAPAGYVPPSLPGVAAGAFAGIFRGRQVVISGTGPGSGLFVYNGTPGPGNLPVFCVVAPGTTTDPFGNGITAIVEIGQQSGGHWHWDSSGNLDINNTSSQLIATWRPTDQALLIYKPGGGAGNMVLSIASVAGTDQFGNTYPQGFGAIAGGYQAVMGPAGADVLALVFNALTSPANTGPRFGVIQATSAGAKAEVTSGLSLVSSTPATIALNDSTAGGGTALLSLQANQINLGALGTALWNDVIQQFSLPVGGGPFIVNESFHVITNAAGVGGTLRVKKLPWNAVWIDCECTFAYTAAAQTFIMGSLPDATYYPTTARRFPVSVTGTPSGITATFPRLFVPTSGAVQIVVPSGTVASGINVSGSFMYPTN